MVRIAKIAEIPPQQAKTGLAGDPEIAKVTIETVPCYVGRPGIFGGPSNKPSKVVP